MVQTKTQRLINRIDTVGGVDHIAQVDFDDPEVDRDLMDEYFASFGCTPDNPHPCSKYAKCVGF